jgi:lysophospholipase L1-like esterase
MDTFSDIVLTSLFASAMTLLVVFWIAETMLKRAQLRYRDIYKTFPVHPEDIVMLGDSITDLTRWHELIPGVAIQNRGISGDTTQGVLNRLDPIVCGKPLALFLLIGTNDIPWYVFTSDQTILKRYEAILKRFKEESPETKIFVQSILPRELRYKTRVLKLNEQLKLLAKQYGCTYVELFPHFSDKSGAMRHDISNDHLHLKADGYQIWVKVIQPYLDELVVQQKALIKARGQQTG